MIRDGHVARQIDVGATPTLMTVTSGITSTIDAAAQTALCTVALPSGGILRFNDTSYLALTDAITFESPCEDHTIHSCQDSSQDSGNSTVVKYDEPFYASVTPQVYALATATIISYILVILIFITPRTFYVGGPGGGANFLGLRSLVPGSGNSSVIGVGRRPLLQKIAAITVAVSLTIATADTFRVAETQYHDGLMNSQDLVEKVIGSVEIRVIRVISDTFLWLAQVQTLIRLFPRHKEKVTIKWLGFALVLLDTIFSILENFVSNNNLTRPKNFQDAIPALSYLFQMSISLIYASCVIYYSLSKRRFAFWHSKMRNILLVAMLSLCSVLVPVVFFVLDVSQPSIATWGEYIRWVGAAAASVGVWVWVERIEALERDEKKDGILGREIFDGDEMLDMGSDNKDNKSSSTSSYFGFGKRNSDDDEKKVSMLPIPHIRPRIPFRRKKTKDGGKEQSDGRRRSVHTNGNPVNRVGPPAQVASPVSRSDTTSAASTVYQVRYQNVSSPSPAIPEEPERPMRGSRQPSVQINGQALGMGDAEARSAAAQPNTSNQATPATTSEEDEKSDPAESRNPQRWQTVANPFKRKRAEPPAEVAAQMAASNVRRSPAQTYHNLRDRLTAFRVGQKERANRRAGPSPPMPITVIPSQPRPSRLTVPGESADTSRRPSMRAIEEERRSSSSRRRHENLPVTVIPAPTRGGRTWSPDDLKDDEASPRVSASGHGRSPGHTQTPALASDGLEARDVHTPRGALVIAESPTRVRDHEARSSPGTHRAAHRLRTPTIDSINDRLSSTSPHSAAVVSVGSEGSEGRSRGVQVGVGTPQLQSTPELHGSLPDRPGTGQDQNG